MKVDVELLSSRSAASLLKFAPPVTGATMTGTFNFPVSSVHSATLSRLQSILHLVIPARGFCQEETYPLYSIQADTMCIPRFFAFDYFGICGEDCRVEGECMAGEFRGVLYDWQEQVVTHLVTKLQGTYGGGVLQADCGLGKTMLGIALAMRLGKRTAVCVNKEFLMNQWKERIEHFCENVTVGIVQGSNFSLGDITLVMLQTVIGGKYEQAAFDSIGFLIFDEVHHVPAKTYSKISHFFRAKITLGLTATPERGDGNEHAIHWAFGPILCRCARAQMASPTRKLRSIETFLGPQANIERNGRLDWTRLITCLVQDQKRNEMIANLIKQQPDDSYVLVISERVKQLEILQEMVDRTDVCLYVGGQGKQKRKREESFNRNPKIVLTTKAMASEGFDWQECNVVLFATPFTTGPTLQQACGRCNRGRNQSSLVIDLIDRTPALKQMARSRGKFFSEKNIVLQ